MLRLGVVAAHVQLGDLRVAIEMQQLGVEVDRCTLAAAGSSSIAPATVATASALSSLPATAAASRSWSLGVVPLSQSDNFAAISKEESGAPASPSSVR